MVVPETLDLNSEIQIALIETEEGREVMTGQVVRTDVDPATGRPAIGVVFPAEDRRPRPSVDPGEPDMDEPGNT